MTAIKWGAYSKESPSVHQRAAAVIHHYRTPQPPTLAVDETFRNTSPIPAATMNSPKSHNKKKKRHRVNNDKIEAELADFKREIEEKYAKSIMNKKYIFPRTIESSLSGSDKSD